MNFNKNILICPDCGSDLNDEAGKLVCLSCKKEYGIKSGIPHLYPNNFIANERNMDYVEHYKFDGEYYDYFEGRSCKATGHDERRLREYILSKIPKTSRKILDVGSGGGWLAKALSKSNVELVSFDISPNNVENILKLNPFEYHIGIVGDALNPPFRKGIFDCIISAEVIEHTVEPKLFIQGLLPLLKPGGALIISTPYKEKIQYSICTHCNKPTPHNAHLHSFDEYKLRDLVDENKVDYNYFTFGNKLLHHARTYVLLQYLPLSLWKIVDKIANLIINRKEHIVLFYKLN
ncbi:MAG: methyltransferase domain-containing protein [Ignavibacteriae bacterium]|nr:methyltransferase domain-containing protein [Ignavibacteriota bacterium]